MKSRTNLVFLTSLYTVYLAFPVRALPTQIDLAQSPICQSAISRAKNLIENAKASVMNVRQYKHRSKDYPENRPLGYDFSLSGVGVYNVLRSRVFLTSITTDIISKCNSVSSVGFGIHRTDAGQVYGLMKNGKIEPFKCIEPNPNTQIIWGEQFCL